MAQNSIFRRLCEKINHFYTVMLVKGIKIMYRRSYKILAKRQHVNKLSSEKDYVNLWKKLDKHPDVNTYRLFARYIGENPSIVSESLVSGIIQPLLNPIEYRPYYQDKNTFDKIVGPEYMPKTLLRCIDGSYLNADYHQVNNLQNILTDINEIEDKVFIKPTKDSSSGEGVICFVREQDGLLHNVEDKRLLDLNFIKEYKDKNQDFIIQRALTQHPSLSFLNPTSINTIRIATYRSVIDNQPHFLGAIIRIGKKGSYKDNAHAGGLFVGVDENGKLGNYVCDQYGNRYDEFNGINFKDNTYHLPYFDKAVKFSEEIANKILHARLIAHDICMEANGDLKLVEFNLRGFAPWLFQYTTGPAFGEYTEEIIDYCAERKKNVSKVFVEAF